MERLPKYYPDFAPIDGDPLTLARSTCGNALRVAHQVTALDLGCYLWVYGKKPMIRQFARHHTKDTIYY